MNTNAKHAKSLAVAYHSYHEAIQTGDWSCAVMWGAMVLEHQEALGITDTLLSRSRYDNVKSFAASCLEDRVD